MATLEKTMITITATIQAMVEKVWNLWTNPKHIIHWNYASDDWHTPRAQNDLRVGGRFLWRMEAKDGSQGFDFKGEYRKVVINKQLFYTLDDGREVRISFASNGNETTITETFEAEHENTVELQKTGWQAILNNFKKYVEAYDSDEAMHFEISINAGVEKVYKTMLDETKWREWTAEFNPSSFFIGSWEKESKILFLGSDKDGTIGGMVSKIRENNPNRFVSIEHQGIVKNGEEMLSGPEVDRWTGALENYTFTVDNGNTILSVDMSGADPEFKSYFAETWPKALNKLKAMCEAE